MFTLAESISLDQREIGIDAETDNNPGEADVINAVCVQNLWKEAFHSIYGMDHTPTTSILLNHTSPVTTAFALLNPTSLTTAATHALLNPTCVISPTHSLLHPTSLSIPTDSLLNHTDVSAENYKPTIFVGKMKRASVQRHQRQQCYLRSVTGSKKHDEKRLRAAISAGNIDAVREMLMDGVNPCSIDEKLRSPLHIAVASGNIGIVRLLLSHGADTNQRDTIGNTALHLAACTSNVPIVTALLQTGTDVNILDGCGRSPLHLALSRLRLLRTEKKLQTSDKLRSEIEQVTDMLREYATRSHNTDMSSQLADLCHRLELTTSVEQIDCVTALLTDLTKLQIEHKKHAAQ